MQLLIWIGAGLTLLGVAGLGWCVRLAIKARRAKLDDTAMRAAMQRVVTLNLAALGLSGLGLAAVVIGILLG